MVKSEKDTDEINQHLRKVQMVGRDPYWIGLTDRLVEGDFVWESTGNSLDYANWNPGEPNGKIYSEEDCIHIELDSQDRRWNDRNCDDSWLYVLCQIGKFSPELLG